MLSAEQIRAARALIRWDQIRLASEAAVSVETIKRLEKMDGPLLAATGTTIAKIEAALTAAGIEFINGTGVKLQVR
ncbi:transcriptional regulator [Mesorhizobium sp. M8A.F.Ca.ET.208.01.1.1]|nr:transcriptional regulator [Mesorhizobium sp. M8A.F.Ca.ET.208.01.1.1]TGT55095.1 transcriptional regulator [Mesorhizobium sp. M8A.F.Ca.ET.167.01.1.1]